MLTLEHTVGIGALDHHGCRLDTGFITVQHIQHFHTVPVRFRPAGIHTVEHLGPVLGLGSARTGMEGQNGIAMVIFAVEHGHQLQFLNGFLHIFHSLLALTGQRRIVFFLDQFQQGLRFLILGGELAETLQLVFHFAHLADNALALLLVVIEAGQRHLMLQLCQPLFTCLNGKCFAQVINGSFHSAEFCFQFVNGDHIVTPWLA